MAKRGEKRERRSMVLEPDAAGSGSEQQDDITRGDCALPGVIKSTPQMSCRATML
jgi:hypothetical protein